MKKGIILLGIVGCILAALSFIVQQEDPWKVPKEYESMKNPVIPNEASIKSGKELYNSYCRSCHGKSGIGAGTKANNLNPSPSDFTTESFQQQTDGALLYKIYFGHRDMPGFKTTIPGNKDVIEGTFGQTRSPGDLINYLRTFAKK